MRRASIVTFAALAWGVFFVVPVAQSTTEVRPASFRSFRTPSKNIACLYSARSRISAAYLRCDILSGLRPQPRAACNLDWTGVTMGPLGRAFPTCAGDTVYLRRSPILAYGRTWKRGGFTCVSRRSGLTCSNRDRHGFFLARARWRTF